MSDAGKEPGEERSFICVVCPKGCLIRVNVRGGEMVGIAGNGCGRGVEYARGEVSNPLRSFSLALCVPGFPEPLSVKTSAPVPKPMIREMAQALYAAAGDVRLPVHVGDVVVPDVCGTGIDAVATKDVGVPRGGLRMPNGRDSLGNG